MIENDITTEEYLEWRNKIHETYKGDNVRNYCHGCPLFAIWLSLGGNHMSCFETTEKYRNTIELPVLEWAIEHTPMQELKNNILKKIEKTVEDDLDNPRRPYIKCYEIVEEAFNGVKDIDKERLIPIMEEYKKRSDEAFEKELDGLMEPVKKMIEKMEKEKADS